MKSVNLQLKITRHVAVCDASLWPVSDAIVGTLDKNEEVEYRGHVIGGMIRILTKDGRDLIVHPKATDME